MKLNDNSIYRMGKFNYNIFFYAKKIDNISLLYNGCLNNVTRLFVYDNIIIKNNEYINLLKKKIKDINKGFCCSFFYIEKFFIYLNKLKISINKDKKKVNLLNDIDYFYNLYNNFISKYNDFILKFLKEDNKDNIKNINMQIMNLKKEFYSNIILEFLNSKNISIKKKFLNIILDHSILYNNIDININDRNFIDIYSLNVNNINLHSESKKKGFQGVVKRFNRSKGPASHGSSLFHNRPGAIGQGIGRVAPGTKLPGRMGGDNIFIKNVSILINNQILSDIILLKGSVPGYKNNLLKIIC